MTEKGFLERRSDDAEFQRLLAREDLIEDFLNTIDRLMIEKRITRTDLAHRLECHPTHVVQLFQRTRELTVSRMADIAFHVGVRVRLTFDAPDQNKEDV